MNYNIRKIIEINITMSSSEAVMFNQGGRQEMILEESCLQNADEVKISVQISKEDLGRHSFIISEASKHRKQWDEINKRENELKNKQSDANHKEEVH